MPRVLILLLAAGLLCAACDDGDEPLSTHAALHEIADEACGELEGVDAAEAASIVDEAIEEAADLGSPKRRSARSSARSARTSWSGSASTDRVEGSLLS